MTRTAARALAEAGLQVRARLHTGPHLQVFEARLSRLSDALSTGPRPFEPRPPEPRPSESRLSDARPADVPGAEGRAAVVKLPRPEFEGHAGAIRLVTREYERLAHLNHPGIVSCLGLVRWAGGAALVLENLPGGDLVPLGGTPPERWLQAAGAILAGLGALHARGHTHGDLKAANVRLTASGRARLIDLGSAEDFGARLGAGGRTRAHEPTRFTFEHACAAQDVYAFAVLIHELATGRLPYGPEPLRNGPPPPPMALGAKDRRFRRLDDRVMATLLADRPRHIGTLIEFCDVIESLIA